jgi:hypothetical protein
LKKNEKDEIENYKKEEMETNKRRLKNLKFDRHNLLMELIVLRVFFFSSHSFPSPFLLYFLTTHKKMIHNMRRRDQRIKLQGNLEVI